MKTPSSRIALHGLQTATPVKSLSYPVEELVEGYKPLYIPWKAGGVKVT